MKKILSCVISLLLVGCSGSAPSNAKAEELATNAIKQRLPPNVTFTIDKSKCEPSSQEGIYKCYFKISATDGTRTENDVTAYSFKKANDKWFIVGMDVVNKDKRAELGFN